MGLHVLFTGLRQLHSNKFVSLLFEAFDDFTNKSALDSVRLDLKISNQEQGKKRAVMRYGRISRVCFHCTSIYSCNGP